MMLKPSLLIGGIGVVALNYVVGYHGMYAKQQGQVRVTEATIAQEQADQQAQAEVGALLTLIDQHRQRLSQEPDASQFARDVVALGREAGIELATITQENPQQLKQVTRLAVSLTFSATYHQLGAFLDRLERSDRFIRIEHLEVASAKNAEGPATAQLVLSTLYLPPVSVEANGKSSASATTRQ